MIKMPSPKMKIYQRQSGPWRQGVTKRSPLSPLSPISPRQSPGCRSGSVLIRTGTPKATVLPQQKLSKSNKSFQSVCEDVKEDTFIWHKKVEKEKKEGWSEHKLKKILKRKAEENAKELLHVKKRREERESRLEEIRKIKEEERRKSEIEHSLTWEKQEEEFFLKQVPLRSQIRLEQGRAKPVDKLARYVTCVLQLDVENIETESPMLHLKGLTADEALDLAEDIKVYKKVHTKEKYQEFWNNIGEVLNLDISQCVKLEPSAGSRNLNKDVEQEILNILEGKTLKQLHILAGNISEKIATQKDIDVSYWERLLVHVKATAARLRLETQHEMYLRTILRKFQTQKRQSSPNPSSSVLSTKSAPEKKDVKRDIVLGATDIKAAGGIEVTERLLVPCGPQEGVQTQDYTINFLREDQVPEGAQILDPEEDSQRLKLARNNIHLGDKPATKYPAKFIEKRQVQEGGLIVTEEEDKKKLQEARLQVLNRNYKNPEQSKPAAAADAGDPSRSDNFSPNLKELGIEINTEGDISFNNEVSVITANQHGIDDCDDKYKPRKPRYFNKIQTGYFWNRYNRTHYDSDNPPPKMVLGYKFNIFYPDLMDKSEMPKFTINPCKDNKDLAIIQFSAGPPYEDIAFQIVNDREWDRREWTGYRAWFNHGVLQLWFRFKKYPYRR